MISLISFIEMFLLPSCFLVFLTGSDFKSTAYSNILGSSVTSLGTSVSAGISSEISKVFSLAFYFILSFFGGLGITGSTGAVMSLGSRQHMCWLYINTCLGLGFPQLPYLIKMTPLVRFSKASPSSYFFNSFSAIFFSFHSAGVSPRPTEPCKNVPSLSVPSLDL
jgi:hypothetical protein